MRHLRFLSSVAVLGLVVAGCQAAVPKAQNQENQAQIGGQTAAATEVFPDFKIKTLDGKEKALKDYRGKIVILDLFATWCPPCRMEIPHFVELQEKYRTVLAVVGLSYDQPQAPETVKKFAAGMKINYDVYWGSEEIANHVGLRGIPHTLVLDQAGRVKAAYVGYQDPEVFENQIKSLQPKPAAPAATTK